MNKFPTQLPEELQAELLTNHSLAKYTSFGVGGAAEFFYKPTSLASLVKLLSLLPADIDIFWLGNGSNLLVRDGGIKGLVIYPKQALHNIELDSECVVKVEVGVFLSILAKKCLENSLKNGEFLAGIPGSVGGALMMNAGSFGESIWKYVTEVETINRHGEIKIRKPCDFKIDYRTVIRPPGEWFVSAKLEFAKGEKEQIAEKMHQMTEKRVASQPPGHHTCGSVFRNPKDNYAGNLIEQCGLKGYKVGGAMVSTKHANFIINQESATATDIEQLIGQIKDKVQAKFGVQLEPEVRIVGLP